MANRDAIIAGVGLADAPRKSRWPARLHRKVRRRVVAQDCPGRVQVGEPPATPVTGGQRP